jgi:hypothetical protein
VAAEDRILRFDRTNKEQTARLVVDARASPRYAINQTIRFARAGRAPAPASLVNLSEGGALARIKAQPVGAPEAAPWPLHLSHGDELWLLDLIELPLPCWLIEAEVGLIRVHVYDDLRTREPLRALIARLAAACQQQRAAQEASTSAAQRAEACPKPAEQERAAEAANPTPGGVWMI